ncbi:MAG: diguanylate cyclase [Anaerolineales bacterium]
METEFRLYMRTLAKGWWIIVVVTLLAVNVAILYSFVATPIYQAQVSFIISPNFSLVQDQDLLINSIDTLDRRSIVSTYSEVVSSNNLTQEALVELGITDPDIAEDYVFNVTVSPDANIIFLFVDGPDAYKVTDLANLVGNKALQYIREIYQIYDIRFLDPAVLPTEPIKPQPVQVILIGAVLGAMIGVGLVFFREQLNVSFDDLRARRMMDGATNTLNKETFERTVQQTLAENPEGVMSAGLFYFRGLEEYYDILPTTVINQILKKAASTIKAELRGTDKVGRWGELSFAVIMPNTPGQAAQNSLERIQGIINKPLTLDQNGDLPFSLKSHLGVASKAPDETSTTLFEHTEQALESAIENDIRSKLYGSM